VFTKASQATAVAIGLGFMVVILVAGSLWTPRGGAVLVQAQEPTSAAASTPAISAEQVRLACRQLKIRDWTQLRQPDVQETEARAILHALGIPESKMSLADFHSGLKVELEHGQKFPDANVTNNHPLITGKIVLAHLKEFPEYYRRLEVLEVEGDMLKAVVSGDTAELPALCRKLATAKLELAEAEAHLLRK